METEMLQYREKCVRGTADFPLSHYRYVRKEKLITPHWHPEIEILYMVSGQMTVSTSEKQYILNPGDIFFVNPEELHAIDARKCGADYHVAVFFPTLFQFRGKHFLEQDFIEPLIDGTLRFPRCITREDLNYDAIQPIVHRMFSDHGDSKALFYADLTVLFCELLERALFVRVEDCSDYLYSEEIKKCIRYMEEKYKQRVTLVELAEFAHMSPNYFCSYFKKHVGVSPFTQLNYIRIKKAEHMLLNGDTPVINIAATCGFESVSFFIRKFKEIVGETPSSYRKKMREYEDDAML